MLIHQLRPKHPNKKKKPRVGRGGKRGTYSGRGIKGQKARAGRRIRPAERDLIQRIPKLRGVKHKPKSEKARAINLKDLDKIKGNTVSAKTLAEAGLIKKSGERVKILSEGELKRPLTLENLEVSKGAREKIMKAGGKIQNNKFRELKAS